jgi:hypothetical protein
MNILETIVGAGNGAAVDQLAAQFGLPREQTSSALGALLPALAAGLQKNMADENGVAGLVSALSRGNHAAYLDNPSRLTDPSTRDDGNAILGHVLGSKDVSRAVAARASQQTGIGTDVLKKMLPLAAALAMGALSRQTRGGSTSATDPGAAGGGILSMLEPLLDRNQSGSMVDDVMGLVGGFLGSRRR